MFIYFIKPYSIYLGLARVSVELSEDGLLQRDELRAPLVQRLVPGLGEGEGEGEGV